jgi:MoaA/NifB/PqqE/SkfB family radical SAM enzyme
MLMPPNDPQREKPLDHPTRERPHRLYVAMTNSCNRACPWCSTCSSPRGGTWLTLADFQASIPAAGFFQAQLEGGEPTVHPQFWDFVRLAREHPRCTHVVLCTNGVKLPRRSDALKAYVARLGQPLTIKLSINHHLLDHDAGLIQLAVDLLAVVRELARDADGERLVVLNVRLRKGYEDDDARVRQAVEMAGLMPHANIFYLQRYGFASGEMGWEPPAPVWHAFTLLNPDGRTYGSDLIARSEAMRSLA